MKYASTNVQVQTDAMSTRIASSLERNRLAAIIATSKAASSSLEMCGVSKLHSRPLRSSSLADLMSAHD